jgi:alpha-tubulin suppressor-like RCC1 family protein
LGLGNIARSPNSFQQVTINGLASNAKIVSVVAGGYHSFVIDSNGRLWATGRSDDGQLGLSYIYGFNLFKPVSF